MSDDSLLSEIADEFIREVQEGKLPDIEKYTAKYPELAERIREFFPTLLLLEGVTGTRGSSQEESLNRSGLSPGSMFGQYRIEREIGRGGMGIVYEAFHLLLEKRVALKVLRVHTSMHAMNLERFFREARTAAGLHHTNIVPVFDVGQVAGTPYFAMQYIEGRSLDAILRVIQPDIKEDTAVIASSDLTIDTDSETHSAAEQTSSKRLENRTNRFIQDGSIRRKAGLPERLEEYFRWVAGIGIQAANGLAHAHERRVIHRDIKPSNLIIDDKGIVWIADFGLARRIEDPSVTLSGVLLGTPRYMSPEQAQGARHPVDQRSDIYSLGATLYELLTCRPVFEGKTPHDVISQIIEHEPVPPKRLSREIPSDLSTIIMKSMAKRPEDRYPSAAQFAEDLNRWLRMEPIKARRIGPLGRFVRWCRRNPRLAAVTATAGMIILILSGIYYASLLRENANTRQALQRETSARNRMLSALNQAEESSERANEARMLAEQERQRAESERNTAEEQKRVADLQRSEALFYGYRSNLLAADLSFQAGDITAAKERLASCDPALCGWEWDYLRRSADKSLSSQSLSSPNLYIPGSFGRDVRQVVFGNSGKSVFIKAYQVIISREDPSSVELSAFRYFPDVDEPLLEAASGTHIIVLSPDGSRALSSMWNLADVNMKCVVEDSGATNHIVCSPGTLNKSAQNSMPKTLSPEERNRFVVTDTMSGRIIATLHHPNAGVWTGISTASDLMVEAGFPRPGLYSVVARSSTEQRQPRLVIANLSGRMPNAFDGAFSRDSSLLATWSWDNIIHIWDLRSQSLLASLEGHESAVRSVSFSTDRTRIASSSADGTVRVWQVESGTEIKKFKVQKAGPLAYGPDGAHIAVGTESGTVQLLDIEGIEVPYMLLA